MSTFEEALEKLKAREQQAREKARAEGRRPLSAVKRRMIESSVKIAAALPDEILFQHSVFCQTVLPYRDPGPGVRKWERQQGNIRLQITAGEVDDNRQRQFVPVGLPYGSAARLMLCHLNTTALQTGTHAVEIDSSMTAFFQRLQGRDCNSRDIQRFKKQLIRLASCIIRFGFHTGPRTVQVDTKIITAFDVGEEYFDGERFLFPQVIKLSADYFESLQTHAVPLDERALASLAHTAMGLDVYTWLAQRLHRVDPQRGQFIPWTALHEQFGQGYDRIRDFRRVFLSVLKAVKLQYPAARVKADKGGLLLGHSPPPVASRHMILLSTDNS